MLAYRNSMMGTLNVYIEENDSKSLIFTQSNSQGNKWNRQAIVLKPKGKFTVNVFYLNSIVEKGDAKFRLHYV